MNKYNEVIFCDNIINKFKIKISNKLSKSKSFSKYYKDSLVYDKITINLYSWINGIKNKIENNKSKNKILDRFNKNHLEILVIIIKNKKYLKQIVIN